MTLFGPKIHLRLVQIQIPGSSDSEGLEGVQECAFFLKKHGDGS